MNACDNGHEKVWHEGKECPACAAMEKLEEKLAKTEAYLDEANSTIDDLRMRGAGE